MSQKQLDEISNLLLAYSSGDYSAKGEISEDVDELDMIISGINMLGEELLATNVSRDFFSSIFNSVTDLVFVLNKEGNILDANDSVYKLFGVEQESLSGQELGSISKGTDLLFDQIHENLKVENVFSREQELINANGERIIGQVTATKLVNRMGEFDGYLILVRDITIQKTNEQKILQAIITTQQREQKRVADVLHDSLGQELSMAKLMISNMEQYQEGNEGLSKLIAVCEEIIDGSVAHLREICFDLMPSVLIKGGLYLAISDLVKRMDSQDRIKAEFFCNDDFPRLSSDLEIVVYRIAQEFINNMIKYSNATELKIELNELDDNWFQMCLAENGQGFDVSILKKISENRGYSNIQSNVNAFNGEFDLESSEKGTTLTVKFPKLKS